MSAFSLYKIQYSVLKISWPKFFPIALFCHGPWQSLVLGKEEREHCQKIATDSHINDSMSFNMGTADCAQFLKQSTARNGKDIREGGKNLEKFHEVASLHWVFWEQGLLSCIQTPLQFHWIQLKHWACNCSWTMHITKFRHVFSTWCLSFCHPWGASCSLFHQCPTGRCC